MAEKTLIAGRGIAGSVLSFCLHEQGVAHDIVDAPQLSASSKVAAGVVNPIVLKRLKLVADAATFISEAQPFYAQLEEKLNLRFYHITAIKHILHGAGDANLWMEKSDNPDYAPHLDHISHESHQHIKAPHGFGVMKNTGWLDTNRFLAAHKEYHRSRGTFEEQELQGQQIMQLADHYDKIIICTGHLMRQLLPQTEQAFAPTRGEVMIIKSSDLPEDAIYHGPVFILPLGNQKFKVGATYHWDDLNDTPTSEGLSRLKSELGKIFSGSYEVVAHHAGVRPNIKDRKPLLGHIAKNLYSFNGMGSRGVLMAPHLAKLLIRSLSGHSAVPDKYDVQRFL